MLIHCFCLLFLTTDPVSQNRVMKERYAHMDERLKSTQEDNYRLRSERDGLRERVIEIQTSLKDKETEVRKMCQMIEFG